jgi:hypothetical protein
MIDRVPKRAGKGGARPQQRGVARFEVLGLETDRQLIRSLAKRLAAGGPNATRIRDMLRRSMSNRAPQKGGIFMALRRSPLVGADLALDRGPISSRKTGFED